MQWTAFLDRFRPTGAPGAAGPRGIPADRRADIEAELVPLLPLLDEIETEADRIRRDAEVRADRIRFDGTRHAQALLDAARTGVLEVAAAAAARVRADAVADESAARAAHQAELAELRTRIAERLPDYLNRAIALTRLLLARSEVGV